MARKPYPSDVTDEEWDFVAPYLTLMTEDAPQREHDLREVFNGMRYVVRGGQPWRMMPNDLPPWAAVYQQAQRWIAAGVFEAMTQDLRRILRLLDGRARSRRRRSSTAARSSRRPRAAGRAGYDGAKRRKGSKVHLAVDTLGHLLSLHVTAADEQDRAQGRPARRDVQSGPAVGRAGVRRPGATPATRPPRPRAAEDRAVGGELPEAKRGFVLLPAAVGGRAELRVARRFRRLAKDYERLASTLKGMHLAAFAIVMLARLVKWPEVHNTL
jgi:transposase